MKSKQLFALLVLLSMAGTAVHAEVPAFGAETVLSMMQSSMGPAANKLASQAITWLGVFSTLQFFMTNYAALKSGGDMQAVLAKSVFSVAWISVCIYIINNGPQFIGAVGEQMFGLLGLSLPSPGSIIKSTIGVVAGLAALAVGVGGVGVLGSTTGGMLLVYILLFVLAIGMFFAFKIFMVQLELGLIVMLSPMSFAFLGLNALKDQGIAPFKALLSLAYRIILLTVILSAFTEVSNVASSTLSEMTSASGFVGKIGKATDVILSALGAYMMLAYLVYKSDSVAATLSSGSTSMGTGDVASAAAAGAAAGAAIMSGGAAAANTAGKAPQLMSDFMQNLGQHGSVTNAMGSGGGGFDAPPPPPAASMSTPGPSQPGGSPAGGFDGTTKTLSPEQSKSVALPYKPPPEAKPSGGSAPASSGGSGQAASGGSDGQAPQNQAASMGSGSNAGVTSPGGGLEKTMEQLSESVNKLGQGHKPGFKDHLSKTNDHIAQEQAATHVSINANAQD